MSVRDRCIQLALSIVVTVSFGLPVARYMEGRNR